MYPDRYRLLHNSAHYLGKKTRHFEQYFDCHPSTLLTPNQKSLQKKKGFFRPKSKSKSGNLLGSKGSHGYAHLNQQSLLHANVQPNEPFSRRNSQTRKPKPKASLFKKKSGQKPSQHDVSPHKLHGGSPHREYDSPSKDHEDIDLLVGIKRKSKKAVSSSSKIIDRFNVLLNENRLSEAIDLLNEALRAEPAPSSQAPQVGPHFDLSYLLGVCYLIHGDYEQAINIFDNLLRGKPPKNVYLLLSVCYKKIESFEEAEKILNECIRKYPKYYEAFIYRGKLYLKLKELKAALADFEKALSLNSQKQIGFVGQGDCLRLMERFEEAQRVYTVALQSKKNVGSILLRRAICAMELRKFEPALDDLNRLLDSDPENSQALYFRGLILNKQRKISGDISKQNEALICFEQAIKFNSNRKAVTRAIYEIAKIKIENRDYYEALYTLERAQYLQIDEKVLKKFRIFTEGATSLMKKNYAQGIQRLTELLEDSEKPLSNFLKPLIFSTRAYGFMSLEKLQSAIDDLDAMERDFSLDLPNLYNKFICQGILACSSSKYEQALALFSKAGRALPYMAEPAFYKAVSLVCFASKLIPKELKDKRTEYLQSALKTVTKVEVSLDSNPSLYMIRAFLRYAFGQFKQAYEDSAKCIESTDHPSALQFYLHGLILCEFHKYQDAVQSFKKAIALDQRKKLPELYLNSAKCMLLLGQVNNGFFDLQSYMSYRSSSPDIHIWAGHLLCFIGAYDDAAKAYSNISNIAKNYEVLEYRARCHLLCKDILNCVAGLKHMQELRPDHKVHTDQTILEAIRDCMHEEPDYEKALETLNRLKAASGQQQPSGNYFHRSDILFLKGLFSFYLKIYDQASLLFTQAFKEAPRFEPAQDDANNSELEMEADQFLNSPNCFTKSEILFNIAIAEIMNGSLPKALRMTKTLIEGLTDSEAKTQFQLFANLITSEMARKFSQSKGVKKASEEEADFMPFTSQDRLCDIFPCITLPLSTPVVTRLYFCLPHPERPDIAPHYDDKLMDEFDMGAIDVRGEAPWIRRTQDGVVFTNQAMQEDIEMSSSSSSEREEEEEEQQAEEQEEYEAEEEEPVPLSREAMLARLRLDDKTEQLLAKLKKPA